MPQKAQGKRSEVWAGLGVYIKAAQALALVSVSSSSSGLQEICSRWFLRDQILTDWTCYIAHGTLLRVMWQLGWEGSLGENGCMYMYG